MNYSSQDLSLRQLSLHNVCINTSTLSASAMIPKDNNIILFYSVYTLLRLYNIQLQPDYNNILYYIL